MGIRTLLKRIEQAEKALLAQSIFSADCISYGQESQTRKGLGSGLVIFFAPRLSDISRACKSRFDGSTII
jgi:hypothetical protein